MFVSGTLYHPVSTISPNVCDLRVYVGFRSQTQEAYLEYAQEEECFRAYTLLGFVHSDCSYEFQFWAVGFDTRLSIAKGSCF